VLQVRGGVTVGQQLQLHGGHDCPAAHTGQAQPQPPASEPPSDEPFIWTHVPVGQVTELQMTASAAHPQASAVSATQLAASLWAAQGSAGGGGEAPHPQGGHDVPAGQAGQPQTIAPPEPEPEAPPAPDVVFAVPDGTVVVVVAPELQAQLHAAQASPGGQGGQLQVQVPEPLPPPPHEPPEPPPPPPQSQAHAGHAVPGGHTGQPQVHVPPPLVPPPASTLGGGGQSHLTGGHGPFAGQTSGCTQRQVLPDVPRAKQYPLPPQS
jgi:hypothetical protein